MTNTVYITDEDKLRQLIREELKENTTKKPDFELSQKMTRREAAKFIGVCYQTMGNWTIAGLIKEHGTGRKKFYLRNELIEALKNS